MNEDEPLQINSIVNQQIEEQKGQSDGKQTELQVKGIVPKDPSAPIGESYGNRKPPKDLEKLATLGFAYVG